MRVLVIEDNAPNLELMSYLLTAFGHTVIEARDGDLGLDLIRRERPDIVACDIQLPQRDGYSILKEVLADPQLRSIPIVAVTALAMVGDRHRVLSAGFAGYIAKPLQPETFVSRLESILESQGGAKE